MKTTLGVAGFLAVSCMCCWGQTNVCPAPDVAFSLSPVRLRAEFGAQSCKPAEVNPSDPEIKPEQQLLSHSVQNVSFEYTLGDNDFRTRLLKPGEFYLGLPEPRSDNAVMRFVDEIFTPEFIHWGKVSVSCPFVTMIKKKNPLCFLSSFTAGKLWTGDGQIRCKILELSW